MNPYYYLSQAWRALSERRTRSGLTIVMVVVGAALVTALDGMNQGMNDFIQAQLNTLGGNVMIIFPSEGGGFGPPSEGARTTLNDGTVNTLRRIPHVTSAIPFITGSAQINAGGNRRIVSVQGLAQTRMNLVYPTLSYESGGPILPSDSVGLVLGYQLAYPPGQTAPFAKVGQTVTIAVSVTVEQNGQQRAKVVTRSFQVKGILNEVGSLGVDSGAYVSLHAANSLFEKAGTYTGIYLITRDPEFNETVEASIREIYKRNIGVISPKSLVATIQQFLGTFSAFFSTIAFFSLIVGGVGIVTTLYTSVMERVREIGLLKALGYTDIEVMGLFLMESILIGILGGMIGLAVGAAGSYALIKINPFAGGQLEFEPVLVPINMLNTFAIAAALSCLAGLYPAWRASRLNPVVALRKE